MIQRSTRHHEFVVINTSYYPYDGRMRISVGRATPVELSSDPQFPISAAHDAPAAARRITISAAHVSQSAPLVAVLCFLCSERVWVVDGRDLRHLATLASVDGCFHAIADGLLRVLVADPTSAAALALLHDFARYVKDKTSELGGQFRELATTLCHQLIAHTNAATVPEINMLRRCIVTFRSRHVDIDESGSESSDFSSDAASASESE